MDLDQNTNTQNPQPGQSYMSQPTPLQFGSSSAPPVSTKKPRKLLTLVYILLIMVVIALLITDLILQQNNARSVKLQLQSVDKRVAVLEAQDQFAEKQVDQNRYQAVFLTNQQTYFAKINKITKDTIRIEDIYYLKTGTVDKAGNPTVGSDVSLAKLGSEIHGPEDTMIVERKNVLFWENLKSNSKVTLAIVQYKKSNP